MVCALQAFACWPRPSSAADANFTTRYDDQIRAAVHRYWATGPDWTWWKAQLYQESRLDPAVESIAGAAGLAQFMPGTWAEVSRRLGIAGISPHVAKYAIDAGAYYMAQLRGAWVADRSLMERHSLAQASYNAGLGHILEAQKVCDDALLWDQIKSCLPVVTGIDNARQTIGYVEQIAHWQEMMR